MPVKCFNVRYYFSIFCTNCVASGVRSKMVLISFIAHRKKGMYDTVYLDCSISSCTMELLKG